MCSCFLLIMFKWNLRIPVQSCRKAGGWSHCERMKMRARGCLLRQLFLAPHCLPQASYLAPVPCQMPVAFDKQDRVYSSACSLVNTNVLTVRIAQPQIFHQTTSTWCLVLPTWPFIYNYFAVFMKVFSYI